MGLLGKLKEKVKNAITGKIFLLVYPYLQLDIENKADSDVWTAYPVNYDLSMCTIHMGLFWWEFVWWEIWSIANLS